MNEHGFIRSIHSRIKRTHAPVHIWKIPGEGGIADCWYDAPEADLWVEYKYTQSFNKNGFVIPNITKQQNHWLTARYNNERNVWVIVGSPDGHIIMRNCEWGGRSEIPPLLSSKAVVAAIIRETAGQRYVPSDTNK